MHHTIIDIQYKDIQKKEARLAGSRSVKKIRINRALKEIGKDILLVVAMIACALILLELITLALMIGDGNIPSDNSIVGYHAWVLVNGVLELFRA